MKKELINLSDNMLEVYTLLQNIDVLTSDVCDQYFSSIDMNKPICFSLLKSQFEVNSIRFGMIREFVIQALNEAKDAYRQVETLNSVVE